MHAALTDMVGYAPHISSAMLAASPNLRSAIERHEAAMASSLPHPALSIARMSVAAARQADVTLTVTPCAKEVLVLSIRQDVHRGTTHQAAEASMWWVDRCLRASMTSDGAARLCCVVRVVDIHLHSLHLYSTEGAATEGEEEMDLHGLHTAVNTGEHSMDATRLRLRVPDGDFALQLCRIPELYKVRCTSAVAEHVVEMDVRSCLCWTSTDVHHFLFHLSSPLRAVLFTAVTLECAALLQRFHASLRFLYARRCTLAREVAAAELAVVLAEARRGDAAQRRPDGTPVLEKLYCVRFAERVLPSWAAWCTGLRSVTLIDCNCVSLEQLTVAPGLVSVTLDHCPQFTDFLSLSRLPLLAHLTIKECGQLRQLTWLAELSGTLETLSLEHMSRAALGGVAESATAGIGLGRLTVLNLAAPSLRALAPLLTRAAATLRELSLRSCVGVEDMGRLPLLPALESVSIVDGPHMHGVDWLTGSLQLHSLRLTQCGRLVSIAGLSQLTELRVLVLNGARQLREIEALGGCLALRYCDLSHCGMLRSVAVLHRLPLLEHVVLHRCLQLPRSFDWLAGCLHLTELVIPGGAWLSAARDALRRLQRLDAVLIR